MLAFLKLAMGRRGRASIAFHRGPVTMAEQLLCLLPLAEKSRPHG
jgi:hypothetical protein